MIPFRSLFASALIAVVVLGAVAAPAVHWAGHSLDAHEALARVDGAAYADTTEITLHTGECPDCARFQKVLGSEPLERPFYASRVGLAPSTPLPESSAVQKDVAALEGRGPPAAA